MSRRHPLQAESSCTSSREATLPPTSDLRPLVTPQKHSRLARLEHFAILLVSSPHSCAFILHRRRHTHSPPNSEFRPDKKSLGSKILPKRFSIDKKYLSLAELSWRKKTVRWTVFSLRPQQLCCEDTSVGYKKAPKVNLSRHFV